MKLRRIPEDFQVEELTDFMPGGGPFALYRLTKRSVGTPEAIDLIAEQWRIPRQRIGYGGLKDRHAVTTQYVTIPGGPRRGLKRPNVELEYLGQAGRAFAAADIRGNRFHLVLRDMTRRDVSRAKLALREAAEDGLPNYFDDQRFGSVGYSGEYVARPWCEGNYERALWLALADPNEHDRPRDKEEKRLLREHWGDWRRLMAEIRSPPRRKVLSVLAHAPTNFREALAAVRVDLRGLYVAAFQSVLWNHMLAALLREACGEKQIFDVELNREPLPFFRRLTSEQRALLHPAELPLPSARLHLEEGPTKALIDRVLAGAGLELRMLRVKYPRDTFFAKGERPVVSQARDLTWRAEPDELHEDRRKLVLDFSLGRGSYATILVKRITET